jgi:hypothetical protein
MKKFALTFALTVLATPCFAGVDLLVTDESPTATETRATMGSTGVFLGKYVFTNLGNNVLILSQLTIADSTMATKASIQNLTLWFDSIFPFQANIPRATPGGYQNVFNLPGQFILPPNVSMTATLRADIPGFNTTGAEDNSVHQFQIVGSTIKAFNILNGAAAQSEGFAYGHPIRILRSDLTIAIDHATETIGVINLISSFSGAIALNKVTITFSCDPEGPPFNPNDVSLWDATNADVTIGVEGAFKIVSGNTITWYFPNPFFALPGYANSLALESTVPVEATIAQSGDVAFADATTSDATVGVPLLLSTPLKITIAPKTFHHGR